MIVWLLFLCSISPIRVYAESFRAVWVVRHEMTSAERVKNVVQKAVGAGLNTLFVQVRGRGDAYYASSFVPPGESIVDGFDPLQACIDNARAAGLSVHAWVNVYLTWYPGRPAPPDHVLSTHPELFMISRDGVDLGSPDLTTDLVSRGVEGRYLSPSHPGVSAHLLRVITEILEKYDVDGIHLDYVRYPNEHYDFSPLAQSSFWAAYSQDPPSKKGAETNEWNRWRSEQVTAFVRRAKRVINRSGRPVRLSAAVKPDIGSAYTRYGQNWVYWVNRRYLDFVVPMFYTGSIDQISGMMKAARKYVQKGHIYAGLGAWNQTTNDTLAQIDAASRAQMDGFSLFSYDTLVNSADLHARLSERYGGSR